ncbi:MAG: hypothetical protein R2827_14030 [Bdellovibrionales bacterium]
MNRKAIGRAIHDQIIKENPAEMNTDAFADYLLLHTHHIDMVRNKMSNKWGTERLSGYTEEDASDKACAYAIWLLRKTAVLLKSEYLNQLSHRCKKICESRKSK